MLPRTELFPRLLQGATPLFLAVAVLVLASLYAPSARAQPHAGSSLDVAAGVGFAAPYDGTEVGAAGGLLEIEYAVVPASWFGVRPYAAGLLTWPIGEDERCARRGRTCELVARIGMVGVKARLALPLPLVAPFLELGFGGSLGLMRTRTLAESIELDSPTYHVPLAAGVAIGPHHEIEIALGFYFHPEAQQFLAALSVGLSLQLTGAPRQGPSY